MPHPARPPVHQLGAGNPCLVIAVGMKASERIHHLGAEIRRRGSVLCQSDSDASRNLCVVAQEREVRSQGSAACEFGHSRQQERG